MKKVYFFEGHFDEVNGLTFKKYDENVVKESGSNIWGDKEYMGDINELNLIDPSIIRGNYDVLVFQGFTYSDEDERELEKKKNEIENNVRNIFKDYLSKKQKIIETELRKIND